MIRYFKTGNILLYYMSIGYRQIKDEFAIIFTQVKGSENDE